MTEIFASLPAKARVLDLGARHGSFKIERQDVLVVRVDLEAFAAHDSAAIVQADAARLPFAGGTFDLGGTSQSIGNIYSANALSGMGGTVTNSVAGPTHTSTLVLGTGGGTFHVAGYARDQHAVYVVCDRCGKTALR